VETVTEWAGRPAETPIPPNDTAVAFVRVDRETRSPGGARYGVLVHAVLATVPLDAEPARIAEIALMHGRVLGATADELDAAATAVRAALAHPLLQRARSAEVGGRCRRETPVTLPIAGGRLLEGVVDLAFEEDDGWTVVDFKTDRELDGLVPRYRRQVALYAEAVARATGRAARAVLLSV
jgi:ATP-dependent exoDNAse (exonuclease V) beta subunit